MALSHVRQTGRAGDGTQEPWLQPAWVTIPLYHFWWLSLGSNHHQVGRVYDLCVYFRTRNPKGLTESGTGELGIIVCGRTSTGQVGLCFLWFFVQELLEAHSAVVMVLKHLRRRGKKLFVAFPWVETSTGPGGFMICVFYFWRELLKAQQKVVLWRSRESNPRPLVYKA